MAVRVYVDRAVEFSGTRLHDVGETETVLSEIGERDVACCRVIVDGPVQIENFGQVLQRLFFSPCVRSFDRIELDADGEMISRVQISRIGACFRLVRECWNCKGKSEQQERKLTKKPVKTPRA